MRSQLSNEEDREQDECRLLSLARQSLIHDVGIEMMKTRIIILLGLLGLVLALSVHLFLQAHPKSQPPQPAPELGMTGWPVQKLSPEEKRQNWERAMVALRNAMRDQEEKVAALQAALGSSPSPETTAELQHEEKVLTLMKQRIQEEENANNPSQSVCSESTGNLRKGDGAD